MKKNLSGAVRINVDMDEQDTLHVENGGGFIRIHQHDDYVWMEYDEAIALSAALTKLCQTHIKQRASALVDDLAENLTALEAIGVTPEWFEENFAALHSAALLAKAHSKATRTT